MPACICLTRPLQYLCMTQAVDVAIGKKGKGASATLARFRRCIKLRMCFTSHNTTALLQITLPVAVVISPCCSIAYDLHTTIVRRAAASFSSSCDCDTIVDLQDETMFRVGYPSTLGTSLMIALLVMMAVVVILNGTSDAAAAASTKSSLDKACFDECHKNDGFSYCFFKCH